MNKSEEVNGFLINGITNVIWKRPGSTAGKTVRANVAAAFPFYDLARLPCDPFAKSAGQPF